MQFGAVIGTACSTFAATNVDDLFVLVTFFAEASTSAVVTPLRILFGQLLGFTVIMVISMIGYGIGAAIPSEPIGFLGLLPISLGMWKAMALIVPSEQGETDDLNRRSTDVLPQDASSPELIQLSDTHDNNSASALAPQAQNETISDQPNSDNTKKHNTETKNKTRTMNIESGLVTTNMPLVISGDASRDMIATDFVSSAPTEQDLDDKKDHTIEQRGVSSSATSRGNPRYLTDKFRLATQYFRTTNGFWKGVTTVAGVTVMNGGDNISTYIPLFSQAHGSEIAVYTVVYYVLLVLWCLVAFLIMKQKHILAVAKRLACYVVPLLYIGLGVYIIIDSQCYIWSIERINMRLPNTRAGQLILGFVTLAVLLPVACILFWFRWRQRRTGLASRSDQNNRSV